MFRDLLRKEISSALISIGLPEVDFSIEHPTVLAHGDFATNAAMVAAKGAGKNPRQLAEELVAALTSRNVKGVKEITIAGPGFINFTLDAVVFRDEVQYIVAQGETYGGQDMWAGKKILVEHSSPNLFKPFHIGHLMNNAVGESIKRLAEFSGADNVTAISFPSDVSLGIAKAVYAFEVLPKDVENIDVAKLVHSVLDDGIYLALEDKIIGFQHMTLRDKMQYLGTHYVRGNSLYDRYPEDQVAIRKIAAELHDKTPGKALDVYNICKKVSLEYFKEITSRLGSEFDDYVFESEAGPEGKEIVEKNKGKVFRESDGAIIYEGEQDGLHTRVFINKEGQPTYEAKDLGLLSLKFKRYFPDLSIFVTDHEQSPYFEVVVTAAGKINPEWKEKTIHRTHGRMTFKGQKMSSRLGGVPLASDVINALVSEVRDRAPELLPEDVDRVAIGAIKFAILRAAAGKNINFDPDTSLSFEGDSGPYLQYTAVRARSVLRKAEAEGFLPCTKDACVYPEGEVAYIEKMLARFPEVVQLSIEEWAPHHIASYLLETAQAFNGWYGNTKILDPQNPAIGYNLAIAKATADVITRGLELLGIAMPSKM